MPAPVCSDEVALPLELSDNARGKVLTQDLNVPVREAMSLTSLIVDRERDSHFVLMGLKGLLKTPNLSDIA